MSIFSIFQNKKTKVEEKPVVRGFSFGGGLINIDLSLDVYYKYYNLNPFVFSAINKRSNEVGARGWELTKGNKTIYNEEIELWVEDSTSGTPKEFFKRLIRDYDISGNTYIFIVKDKTSKPIGLQILDPRYVKPIADKFGTLLGYIQNLEGIKVYLPDDICHLKNDNDIDNEIVGKSRMTSLFMDIETDQEARESNLAFFRNNQTPSSIVVLDPKFEIEEESKTDILQKIKEIFEGGKFQGGKNKHRGMVLQGVKEIIKVQDKISDMEFLELRKFTMDIVFSIYEVPKSILGYTESANYSNGLTQYDIYFDTIEALEDKFSKFLTKVFKVFDEKYEFMFLKDNLRRLNQKSEIAGSLYKDKGLITLNEARSIIQYEKVEKGDEFMNFTEKKEEETKEEKK